MPPPSPLAPLLLNVGQVAELTGLSRSTLDHMRSRGDQESPPWVKVRGRVLYPTAALQRWADERLNNSNGDDA